MADTRVDELRRRLERDPGSRLFAQLAEELRKSGELPEAIRVARAGLAVHPAYPSARLTLGRALLESGDPAAARAELESALRDAPDNILASRFLAQAREALGDLAGAAEQYRRTLLMAPGDRQLQAALQAIESRAAAPGPPTPARLADTTPPRRAPPPPPRRPEPEAATPGEQDEEPLPPTLRIRTSQVDFAAPPPQAVPPAQPAPAPPAPPAPAPPAPRAAQAPPAPPAAFAPLAPPPPAPPSPPVSMPPHAGPPPAPEPPPTPRGEVTAQLHAEWAPAGVEGSTLPPGTHSAMDSGGPAGDAGHAAASAPAAGAPAPPFSSSTLAELYFQQGLVEKAVEVYRQVVQQEPGNEKAHRRLAELESGGGDEQQAARRRAIERVIAGLEQLLGAVRRR